MYSNAPAYYIQVGKIPASLCSQSCSLSLKLLRENGVDETHILLAYILETCFTLSH